ncbi:hypothetical protein H4R18_003830 [Coemansia javaensis]|uniref:Ribosome biogenesis protein NOP53 n=1 Tax=Coemansia javaensis TaxID=2761396 RepID=A0A9W8LFR1_9FUNG|nr:hypothetical protein H4R18_003830 [Coemansia javaensis]
MSTVAMAPAGDATRRARGGRKGKAAWRKNIDLADVEAGLEERREEERQGGAVVEKRQDGDLFTMDTAGDDKTRAQVRARRGLRVDEILGRRSKVPAPVLGSKLGEERRRKRAALETKRQVERIASRGALDAVKVDAGAGDYDLWGAPGAAPAKRAKTPLSRKRLVHLAGLPAVEVAHPGASYRPTERDHSELVVKASEQYAAQLRSDGKFEEFRGFRGVDAADGAVECAEFVYGEMAHPGAAEEEEDDEGEDDDDDDKTVHEGEKRRAPKPKTRTDRNRQRRATQRQVEEQKAKALRRHMHELGLAARLGAAADKGAASRDEAAERTRRLAQEKEARPLKRIGKYAVPELPEAVKLTEDLPGSLRELQPEASSFADTFNSLVKRNLIEPRVPVQPKRNKWRVKTTEKWSYKDFK